MISDRGETWTQEISQRKLYIANASRTEKYKNMAEFLHDEKELSIHIFEKLQFGKLKIDVTDMDWDMYFQEIRKFINVSRITHAFGQFKELLGEYQEISSGQICEMNNAYKLLQIKRMMGNSLFVGFHSYNNPPVLDDRGKFWLPGFCDIMVNFDRTEDGNIEYMRINDINVNHKHFYQHFTERLQNTVWKKKN